MDDSTETAAQVESIILVELKFKGPPEAQSRRLKALLKYALRVFNFRALSIREVRK